jgi:hypothetical protein
VSCWIFEETYVLERTIKNIVNPNFNSGLISAQRYDIWTHYLYGWLVDDKNVQNWYFRAQGKTEIKSDSLQVPWCRR